MGAQKRPNRRRRNASKSHHKIKQDALESGDTWKQTHRESKISMTSRRRSHNQPNCHKKSACHFPRSISRSWLNKAKKLLKNPRTYSISMSSINSTRLGGSWRPLTRQVDHRQSTTRSKTCSRVPELLQIKLHSQNEGYQIDQGAESTRGLS